MTFVAAGQLSRIAILLAVGMLCFLTQETNPKAHPRTHTHPGPFACTEGMAGPLSVHAIAPWLCKSYDVRANHRPNTIALVVISQSPITLAVKVADPKSTTRAESESRKPRCPCSPPPCARTQQQAPCIQIPPQQLSRHHRVPRRRPRWTQDASAKTPKQRPHANRARSHANRARAGAARSSHRPKPRQRY
jgi:hypothetical protein